MWRVALGLLCAAAAFARASRADIPFERMAPFVSEGVAARAFERGSWLAKHGARLGRTPLPVDPWDLVWSPPRHLLMDRARASIQWEGAAAFGGRGGQGVVIGIVDTGIDVSHADLRAADGSTRVAWLLDFFKNPAGAQPALEEQYGCSAEVGLRCQILSAADIDERLRNGVVGDEPKDELGHGTHVASIAAGNGAAAPSGMFTGVAPEATLIVVRASGQNATLTDNDIVLGTQFVFERAQELGMPAVVNLSLGSDFGPHDGSSVLARALANLVGPEHPGRAIVVAAGNSGATLSGLTTAVPEPLGIHTGVSVSAGNAVRVPLLTPPPLSGAETTDASLYVWIETQSADELSIGLEGPSALQLDAVAPGASASARTGELAALVINSVGSEEPAALVSSTLPDLFAPSELPAGSGKAALFVDGRWPAGATFNVVLRGRGRVDLWVQSEGDLGPIAHPTGALFSGASSQQTITLPAVHPDLIAVGASVNRVSWTDRNGAEVRVSRPRFGSFDYVPGAAASFSSAGPNAMGFTKPDLVAPGAFVIAALAAQADPRSNLNSAFASGAFCANILDCQISDAAHAVNTGTSMAAPMVSGAVALLFAADPTLTQADVRELLQAGAEPLTPLEADAPREGAGGLALERSLRAQTLATSGAVPDASQSRLLFARDYALPDPALALEALLQLRDGAGDIVDGFDASRLELGVSGGSFSAEPRRTAPGLYKMRVSAAARRSLSIEVRFDRRPLLEGSVPVTGGAATEPSDGGGCALGNPRPAQLPRAALLSCGVALAVYLRRRSCRVVSRAGARSAV